MRRERICGLTAPHLNLWQCLVAAVLILKREGHSAALPQPKKQNIEEYVLVAQDKSEVTLLRRGEGWKPMVASSFDGTVEFRSIQLSMTLAEIYERVF